MFKLELLETGQCLRIPADPSPSDQAIDQGIQALDGQDSQKARGAWNSYKDAEEPKERGVRYLVDFAESTLEQRVCSPADNISDSGARTLFLSAIDSLIRKQVRHQAPKS